METIGDKLDKLYPVKCCFCGEPYKRNDGYICKKCGQDQNSPEAYIAQKVKRQVENEQNNTTLSFG